MSIVPTKYKNCGIITNKYCNCDDSAIEIKNNNKGFFMVNAKILKNMLSYTIAVIFLVACDAGNKQRNNNISKQQCEQECKKNITYWIKTDQGINKYITTHQDLKKRFINGKKDCANRFPELDIEWTKCNAEIGKIFVEGKFANLNNLDKFAPQELNKYNICIKTCNK
ncbi:MAG TPA: hypothetical protein PKD00_10995 [Burkholderiales bacterium]|nr:hypothetical protein [Burkholderiales bacterium]